MSAGDLDQLFDSQERVRRWTAERENASARLQLARIDEACAFLLSQHEPVASSGVDRPSLRVFLSFIKHGDEARLARDLHELKETGRER